ncbi:hypothetical protein [Methanobrevibacter sp.]|uniref:hypothetical protein n=1 Tax=Methanobrevibacter sp. TaxID=66852 RepID=UPI00386F9F02
MKIYTIDEEINNLLKKHTADSILESMQEYGVLIEMELAYGLVEYEHALIEILCEETVRVKENGLISIKTAEEKKLLDKQIVGELDSLYRIKQYQSDYTTNRE